MLRDALQGASVRDAAATVAAATGTETPRLRPRARTRQGSDVSNDCQTVARTPALPLPIYNARKHWRAWAFALILGVLAQPRPRHISAAWKRQHYALNSFVRRF